MTEDGLGSVDNFGPGPTWDTFDRIVWELDRAWNTIDELKALCRDNGLASAAAGVVIRNRQRPTWMDWQRKRKEQP